MHFPKLVPTLACLRAELRRNLRSTPGLLGLAAIAVVGACLAAALASAEREGFSDAESLFLNAAAIGLKTVESAIPSSKSSKPSLRQSTDGRPEPVSDTAPIEYARGQGPRTGNADLDPEYARGQGPRTGNADLDPKYARGQGPRTGNADLDAEPSQGRSSWTGLPESTPSISNAESPPDSKLQAPTQSSHPAPRRDSAFLAALLGGFLLQAAVYLAYLVSASDTNLQEGRLERLGQADGLVSSYIFGRNCASVLLSCVAASLGFFSGLLAFGVSPELAWRSVSLCACAGALCLFLSGIASIPVFLATHPALRAALFYAFGGGLVYIAFGFILVSDVVSDDSIGFDPAALFALVGSSAEAFAGSAWAPWAAAAAFAGAALLPPAACSLLVGSRWRRRLLGARR